MDPSSGAVEVFVFKDGRFLGSRCYSQSTIVIGRGRNATLKLHDPTISERHAIIRVEGGSLVLADNDSHGGCFVNGERVSVRNVSSFDEVAIGPFRLKVTLLGQEDEDPGFGAEEVDAATASGPPAGMQAPVPAPAPAVAPAHLDGGEDPYAEAETVVRRVDDLPEYRQMEEATLPRIVKPPSREPDFDDLETRAAGGAGRLRDPFSAREVLDQPAPQQDGPYEEMPTKAERPAGLFPAGESSEPGFEEFSQEPRAPARPARQEAAEVPAAARMEEPYPEEEPPASAAAAEEPELPEEPEPPAAGAEPDDGVDEDDEDEENFVEPFSLLENVVRERFKSKAETEPVLTLEVIEYHGSEIRNLLRADAGRSVRVGFDDFHLATMEKGNRASVYFQKDFKGTLVSKGKARPLKNFCTDKFKADRQGRLFAVSLAEGDYAQIVRGNQGYLIRFVRPPTQPRMDVSVGKWVVGLVGGTLGLQIFLGSAAFHFLILVLLGFVAPEADLTVVSDAERFAKVAMKDLKLEKPKDEPKQEKPEEVEPPKVKDLPKVPRRIRRIKNARPMTKAQQKRAQKKAVKNVLSALENLKPGSAGPGRSNLKSLTSNIAAVRTPGGSSGSFKVAGVISKIPGGGVRLAGGVGGGGGKDTRVGSQLLAGGKVGKIRAAAGTGTRVRGRVRRAPKRAIRATGGVLDRGAIQKVVNRHMAAIQRCYEVQLLKNPGLAGKVVFDWVITPSGGVGSARQVRSSMRSPAVATCILAQIRTWRFPKPVGGSVKVRYPFVFRIQGF